MSIKLFYCYQCDRYYSEVLADVVVRTSIKLDIYSGEFYITGEELPYGESVHADTFSCPCGDKEHNIIVKYVDKCQHEWETRHSAWKSYRKCRLCDAEQEGKVVYD